MVLAHDMELVAEVSNSLVKLLVDKGCLISPKSVLIPVQKLAWLGKQFYLVSGSISNPGAYMGGEGGGGAEPRAPTTIFMMRPHLPAPSPQQCTKQFDDCAICGSIVLRVAPTPLAGPSAAPPHIGGGGKQKAVEQ